MKTPQAGQLLDGRYRILRPLAEGGFGQTYVAEDTRLPGQPLCVVKYLKPAVGSSALLNNARRLFNTEGEILQLLGKHEHIPQLLAFFEEDENFFLVQEFIEGHTLTKELLPGRPWHDAAVCQLLWEILTVLEFVHAHGVIHRDIKPDNLIRRQRDNKLLVVDFGTVKQVRNPTKLDMQISATIAVGTPGYMPTEQSHGKPRPNSDIYALGIIGVQALTGVLPSELPEDSKTGELIWQPPVKVDKRLVNILKQMVRYHFKDRYQSASQVLKDLAPLIRRYGVTSRLQNNVGSAAISEWWTKISSRLTTQKLPTSSRSNLRQAAPTALSYAPQPSPSALSDAQAQPTILSVNALTNDLAAPTVAASNVPQKTVLSDVPPESLPPSETSPQMTILSAVPPEVLTSNSTSLPTAIDPLPITTELAIESQSDRHQSAPQQTILSFPDAVAYPISDPSSVSTDSTEISLGVGKTEILPTVSGQRSEEMLNALTTAAVSQDETDSALPTPLDQSLSRQPQPERWRSQTRWLIGVGSVGAIAATVGVLVFAKQYQDYANAQKELAKIEGFAIAKDYEPCVQQAKQFESRAVDLNARARSLWGQCLVAQATALAAENQFLDALALMVNLPSDPEATVQAKALKASILDSATQRYRQGKFTEATAIATALTDDESIGETAKQQLESWEREQDNNAIALAAANKALAASQWTEAIKHAESLKILGQPIANDIQYWKNTVEPIIAKAQQGREAAERQAQARNRATTQRAPSSRPTATRTRRQLQQPRQNPSRPSGGQSSGGGWNFKPL